MKINGINTINMINNYKGNIEKIRENSKIQKTGDVIEISDAGKTLNAYRTSMPVTDNSDKIAELKEKIANGSYNVDPSDTAKAMINFMGDNEF